jgi:hypothetical protein
LAPGETRLLAAQIQGQGSPNFTWAITSGGGRLAGAVPGNDPTVENNTYEAPTGRTDAEIRVTHTQSNGDEVSETLFITVGECNAGVVVAGDLEAVADSPDSSGFEAQSSDFASDEDAFELPRPPAAPAIPQDFWVDRREDFAAPPLQAMSTFFGTSVAACVAEADPDNCQDRGLDPLGAIEARTEASSAFSVDTEGVARMTFNFNGSSGCLESPQNARTYCTRANADSTWTSWIYTELEAPGLYELKVDLTCVQSERGLGESIITFRGVRYPQGQEPFEPLNGASVEDFQDRFPDYNTIDLGDPTRNVCMDGGFNFTRQYELKGPDRGETDLIVWTFETDQRAVVANNPTTSSFEDHSNASVFDREDPNPGQDGSYSGSVTIEGEIEFQRMGQ